MHTRTSVRRRAHMLLLDILDILDILNIFVSEAVEPWGCGLEAVKPWGCGLEANTPPGPRAS